MSSAILFYGYNLGAPDDAGWAIEDEVDFEEAWYTAALDLDEGYVEAMNRRLLEASGMNPDEIDASHTEMVARRCNVRVVHYGHSNTQFYGLALADSVHVADDWSPKHVAPVTSYATPDPLASALEVLGMKPTQANPSWILAPQEY